MNFKINNVESYSERANRVSVSFTDDVPGIPSGFAFNLYMPKSFEVKVGIQDIPHWIAQGIWMGSFQFISKSIGKYAYDNAGKGNKRAAKTAAIQAFSDASKLNVEVEEVFQEVGKFVGNVGDKILDEFKVVDHISSKSYTSDRWEHSNGYWRHPYVTRHTWKLEDKEGNCYMASIANDDLNASFDELNKSKKIAVIQAYISKHSEFRGVKQTWLAISKRDLKEIKD